MPEYAFSLDSPGVTDVIIPDINRNRRFIINASILVDGDVLWSAQANQGDVFNTSVFDWVDVEDTANSTNNLDILIDYPIRGFRINYHSGTGTVSGLISY